MNFSLIINWNFAESTVHKEEEIDDSINYIYTNHPQPAEQAHMNNFVSDIKASHSISDLPAQSLNFISIS